MLFFFPRGVLDEILNLIESVSEGFPSTLIIRKSENGIYCHAIAGVLTKKNYRNS